MRALQFLGLCLWVGLAFGGARADPSAVLTEWDIPVTGGAAPGYVPDAICGNCHQDRFDSFQSVGMAKSFYRPGADKVIEDFQNADYFHAPSNLHYRMELRDGDYWFHRYQLNAAGQQIHRLDRKIDWILGSGHHSRVYLYRAANGEMFQLPLAWYSQDGGKWDMAPGFEFADHLGEQRLVRQRCMACHNAFPDVPAGSDRPGMLETFPADLPQGIGCQRCHGPGAAHVEMVLTGDAELPEIRAAIVNPARLPNDRLYSICYGCHMQPSVAVTPELRLGRSVYSFRPGQSLDDYKTFLDIEDGLRTRAQRFDINHHPYRLEQSQCFIQSEGQMGCLTCHDPHRKVAPENRASHYRAACLECHQTTDQGLPVMASGAAHPALEQDADCTTCHMPLRRTQDVIHAKMTDHRIVRDPGPAEALVKPIPKLPADVVGVSLLYPDRGLSSVEAVLAQTSGILNFSGFKADYAAQAMARVIGQQQQPHYEPWLSLSRAYFTQKDYADALQAAESGLALAPQISQLRLQQAVSLFALGQVDQALARIDALLLDEPGNSHAAYNRALILLTLGQSAQALDQARQVLTLSDGYWPAWRLIARIQAEQGNSQAAIDAYLNALRLEPRDPDSAAGLGQVLDQAGRGDEADSYRAAE